MLLIDTLLTAEAGSGCAETTISHDGIAMSDSRELAPAIFIELMAQTYAAVKGWEILQTGKEFPIGYLVGVQKFKAIGTATSGQKLTINVETVGEFEGFAVVEGFVKQSDTILAQGKIKLWVPEEGA